MYFTGKFYPYQQEILEIFEKERARGDKKIHIVAPPGSGKTIIGLEMLARLNAPALILVPNLVLQKQWEDKLQEHFRNESNTTISCSKDIKNISDINIITYQSLASTKEDSDEIKESILSLWYKAEESEFGNYEVFCTFIENLKETSTDEYTELYTKYRKKLKISGDTSIVNKMLDEKVLSYIEELKKAGVRTLIVDEAHHLTSWWSFVLYEIWKLLQEPHIIGLTATPPYENTDYFELDDNYTQLLGTVDYYTPTPAVIRGGRLAPYSDLVYFVEPDKELAKILQNKEEEIWSCIQDHKSEIVQVLHEYLKTHSESSKKSQQKTIESYLRFVYNFKDEALDISSYISPLAHGPIKMEDIAKSIGKWISSIPKIENRALISGVKELLFDLGYIWRASNFYRFETPLEKGLVYSKTKILGVQTIINHEKKLLKDTLKIAVITDFLDENSTWINAHYLFNEITSAHPELGVYLVSGQGVWKIENGVKTLVKETIFEVTEKLGKGEIKIIIGTRGMLGEGWDCPELNTLIDLTGTSAYMTVNQVHGRAIRLDKKSPRKLANIYDIVCLGKGFQGVRDFERLSKKHEQFYGADENGLIIKGLDHIYPQLESNFRKINEINAYTLKKAQGREIFYELWGIGKEYENKEIFSLSLEVERPYEIVPLPARLSLHEYYHMFEANWQGSNALKYGDTKYFMFVKEWITEILDACLRVMSHEHGVESKLTYQLYQTETGGITITSSSTDPLISKKFIELVGGIFSPITNEAYKLTNINDTDILDRLVEVENNRSSIRDITLMFSSILSLFISIPIFSPTVNITIIIIVIGVFHGYLLKISKSYKNSKIQKIQNNGTKINQLNASRNSGKNLRTELHIGLPKELSSNKEKRKLFIGTAKEELSISSIHTFFNFLIPILVIFGIIKFQILGIVFGYIAIISLVIVSHAFKAYGYIKPAKNKALLTGSIEPVEKEDIGTYPFIRSKIEKLWI